jgi:hypothetical protein
VPQVVLIDPGRCLQFRTGKCRKTCVEACADRHAIDFTQTEELIEIKVGNIIVATGFKLFDAGRIPQYGYGRYPNVVTSTGAGAAGQQLRAERRRSSDARWPDAEICRLHPLRRLARHEDQPLVLAHLLHAFDEAGAARARAYRRGGHGFLSSTSARRAKGCEEFYDKSLKEGVQFVRGRVAEVTDWALAPEEEGKLVIRVEDTLAGFVRRIPVDMIVLAVGMEPQADAQDVRRLFNMSCGSEGWFLERHPKARAGEHLYRRHFIAGCCQGPKDIPDSIAQAGAAAAEAMALIDKGYVEQEPNTAYIVEERLLAAANRAFRFAPIPRSLSTKKKARRPSTPRYAKAAAPAWPPARAARSGKTCSRTKKSSARSKECWRYERKNLATAHRGVLLQLVHLHRGRPRRGVAAEIRAGSPHRPPHVLGAGGSAVCPRRVGAGRRWHPDRRLPHRRLPLRRGQSQDVTAI